MLQRASLWTILKIRPTSLPPKKETISMGEIETIAKWIQMAGLFLGSYYIHTHVLPMIFFKFGNDW